MSLPSIFPTVATSPDASREASTAPLEVSRPGTFFCESCFWTDLVSYEYDWSVYTYDAAQCEYVNVAEDVADDDDDAIFVPLQYLLSMNLARRHVCDSCRCVFRRHAVIFRMRDVVTNGLRRDMLQPHLFRSSIDTALERCRPTQSNTHSPHNSRSSSRRSQRP